GIAGHLPGFGNRYPKPVAELAHFFAIPRNTLADRFGRDEPFAVIRAAETVRGCGNLWKRARPDYGKPSSRTGAGPAAIPEFTWFRGRMPRSSPQAVAMRGRSGCARRRRRTAS